jgi:hypothetical protein
MIFRIHRMKDAPRENFRWAAHTGGVAVVKPKDYDAGGEVEGATPYAAWQLLKESDQPLRAGDVLEDASGTLQIAKYIGFEKAQWWVPEPKPLAPPAAQSGEASGQPAETDPRAF